MAELGKLVVELSANIARFQSDMDKAQHVAENSMDTIKGVAEKASAALASIGVGMELSGLLSEQIKLLREAEQESLRLDAVLRATGGSAGITKTEINKMVEELAKTTQFDDEGIKRAASELLKFGNIQGNTFRESLKLSTDVAAFMGTDLPEAAAKLGKSLVDPETAFGLLKKAGIALTEQQKDQIKAFQASGDVASAQNVILHELQHAFEGTAETMNTGLAKATNDLQKNWDELLKTFGRTSPMVTLAGNSLSVLGGALRNLKELLDETHEKAKNSILFSAT